MLAKLFSDDGGNLSSMRLVFMLVVATVLFNWTWINIKTGAMQPLDWGSVAAIVGMGWAKSSQKSLESGQAGMASTPARTE